MSIFTLFAANLVVLLVTAVAFGAAWHGRRDGLYWRSWIAANVTLAAALLLLMLAPSRQAGIAIALGNGLLVAGFGLRWRAARQFGTRPASRVGTWAPTLFTMALFAAPELFGHGLVFTLVNVILTVQALATGHEFSRDRGDRLPSRYALVVAYWLMAASFAARIGQGLVGAPASYLPQDWMLHAHLYVALVYTTGSAAFLLSLVYEKGALELRRAALTDALTGLPNRRAFEARLEECLSAGRAGFAVILLDIDHFKAINDLYGHSAGDIALRACADICAGTLGPSGFIARIGGEEFAAILPDADARKAWDTAEQLRSAVEAERLTWQGRDFGLTLSAGIAHAEEGHGAFDRLMREADLALYRAKSRGRNRIEQAAA